MESVLGRYSMVALRSVSCRIAIPAFNPPLQLSCRNSCKTAVSIDPEILSSLEGEEMKPRQHPGIINMKRIELPLRIRNALTKIIGDYPLKSIQREGINLNNYLRARHPPMEKMQSERILTKIIDEINHTMPNKTDSQENQLAALDPELKEKQRVNLLKKRLKERIYAWKPIDYTEYMARVYAVARAAREYSVLCRILQEIVARDPTFRPNSYFDFGSGIGSGMWAAHRYWADSIFEYFNVDSSRAMNDLSELILRNGNENEQMTMRNVFYRQFLPHLETKYDLVLCSYSLFELPNQRAREEVLLNLWQKCDGYLIVVEEGSRKGFELVHEARRLILKRNVTTKDNSTVFAPCPHEMICPRFADTKESLPCSFEATYLEPEMGRKQSGKCSKALYSYVVLRKTPSSKNSIENENIENKNIGGFDNEMTDPLRENNGAASTSAEKQNWPRLIEPTLIRPRHTICRMCTAEGKFREIIFTNSKHGKIVHRCAKASRWGDRLPIKL